ncbi:MAG: hypothetical protein WCA35_10545 [Kovacikia sp.]
MKLRSLLAVLGMAALLVSCSSSPDNNQAQAPTGQTADGTAQSPPPSAKPQNFPNPLASPTAIAGVRAVPGLLQPTNAQARIPTIPTGRRDPFAAVMTPPLAFTPGGKVTVSSSIPAQGALPRFKPATLPNFSPRPNSGAFPPIRVSAAPGSNALPAMPIPMAPPSRTNQAEAIEISGALQIGGTWAIIVKEPGAATSRYVKAGDYLANGQVLVKRIIAGSDPTVVLQQNGVEVSKSIGSSTGPIARNS